MEAPAGRGGGGEREGGEEAILFEIGKHTCSDDGSAPGIRR